MNQTPVKIELKIADAKQEVLEKILLRKYNGTIEVPENNLISKGHYWMGKTNEYVAFKQMIRRKAQIKYGNSVGVSFSKQEKAKLFSLFY